MRTIQDLLEEILEDLPHQMLSDLVKQKLDEQGVTLSALEINELTKTILQGDKNTVSFKREGLASDRKVTVHFSSEDIEQIERKVDRLHNGGLITAVEKATEDASQRLLASLKQRWTTESCLQRQEIAEFKERLYACWQLPLERLRMLLTISRELGADINQTARQSTDAIKCKYLVEVLSRLHARACQITEEILCLLEGGFADGAMARWRTLHEVAVVASFIADHGEDLAERYVLHQAVEAHRAANEYQKCHQPSGYEALEESTLQAFEESYNAAIARFGQEFKGTYGWAAYHLKIAKPNFDDIERAVGNGHLRAHYRMASHNVHANPKGAFFKLGNLDEPQLLLSGPSNAGMADPGYRAALSLAHISATIAMLESTVDNNMLLQVIFQLMIEVVDLFEEADKHLAEDVSQSQGQPI